MLVLVALLPVLVFWLLETQYGTGVATVAAVIVALLEVAWRRWKDGRWARLPLVTAGLVVVLGGLSLASDNPRFVRATPVVGDVVMAGLLAVAVARGANPLLTAVAEAEPGVPVSDDERRWLNGVAWRVVANLMAHGALCLWASGLDLNTWAFVSGPLQLGMLGLQVAGEALAVRYGPRA